MGEQLLEAGIAQDLDARTDVRTEVKPSMKQTKAAPRATADQMAARQRDISVSEFFAKNRHLLGFDNPRKALLTTVKEAVDNSLDACEEAGILPEITVVIEDLQPDRGANAKSSRYRVTIADNGPGIVRKQVENIFGRLLYGSKFHRLKMSRGQQGIGISAAGMYGLITTGRPMVIHTKPKAHQPAHHIELAMNTKINRAEVTIDDETDDFPPQRLRTLTPGTRELFAAGEFLSPASYTTGTSVSIELDGKYQRGRGSVDEFLELTAIANPHARIVFVPPGKGFADEADDAELLVEATKKKAATPATIRTMGEPAPESAPAAAEPAPAAPAVTTETRGVIVFPRGVDELPPETKEIQPHPKGVELGILQQMLKEAEVEKAGMTLYTFLQEKFSRVSAATASEFCQAIGVSSRAKVTDIDHAKAEALFRVLQDSKLPPPPTDCLAPIGVRQMLSGLLKGVRAEFYAASSREAAVYRGRPFLIEAAIAFGGDLPSEESARVIRFANRVPLQYQQSACSSFRAVTETNWRNYDLQQPKGGVPQGPIMVMIHMASVWVPFTSESKEAIADYDDIRKEMKLALMECGRKLGVYLRRRKRMQAEAQRRDIFEKYIGEISKAIEAINGTDAKTLYEALLAQAKKRTAIADAKLDEDGRFRKDSEDDPADQEGVIVVESAVPKDIAQAGKASSAEQAMLKVHALAHQDDEDEQGSLLDVKSAPRASAKATAKASGKGTAKAAKGDTARAESPRAGAKQTAPRADKPAAKAAAPSASPRSTSKGADTSPGKPASKPAASKPAGKPKMRLVNGKLVPVDEGGLFSS